MRPTDAVDDLAALLRDADAPVTLDFERDITKPCVVCGDGDRAVYFPGTKPRLCNDLVRVGTYAVATGGGMRRGSAMTRPVCSVCGAQMAREGTLPPPAHRDPG